MSERYARVQKIELKKYKRVIAVSDIHGDADGLAATLQQINFTENDALVVVGDMIEKGEHSLDALRLVMNLSRRGNVLAVSGNNEAFVREWLYGTISDEDLLRYVASRDTGLILELAEQLPISLKTSDDVARLREGAEKHFPAELSFLQSLPQILESESFLFVHAGLKPGSLLEQDYWYCQTAPAFGQQTHIFEKPLIVGHWPASNYCDTVINANPYFHPDTNVISIDGGNSMKSWAQINYLILDPETGTISSGYCDSLPKIRALDPQTGTADPLTLTFPNTQIEIREKYAAESLCFVPYLGRELTVSNDRIYDYKGKTYCYDFTTYDLPVEEGESLAFCGRIPNGILVKRNGIVGNYRGRYEFL